jgi:hypothetical protein
MKTEKTAINFARLVVSIIFIAAMVAAGLYLYQSCNQENVSDGKSGKEFSSQKHEKESWYHYPSIGLIQARLVQLANRGCETPFNECLHPSSAKWQILNIMNRDKIQFGTPGLMSLDKLDQLVAMADERIVDQELAYLKAQGGVKFSSDLSLLQAICYTVYDSKRPFLGYRPTDAELKELLPPGATVLSGCEWKDN